MLVEFLTWWRGELLALIPSGLRGNAASQARGLILCLHDLPPSSARAAARPSIEVLIRRRGRDSLRGRFGLADAAGLRGAASGVRGPVLLRLPPGLLLEQHVSLPLAAEREPERVLTYEMDRLTPFPADALFWRWALDRRDPVAGRVHFRLSLVPKARLTPVLDRLAEAGLRPVALEAPAADGQSRRLALAHERRRPWQRSAQVLAGGLCTALAAAAIIIPFINQDRTAADIEARIAALRPQVEQAETLRRTLLERTATTDAIQAGRAQAGEALGILAGLTTVLPDDTFLTDLTLRGRQLVISGESAAATRLISLLSAEPGFINPTFAAPVTRAINGSDSFSIRAEATQ